MVLLLTLTSAAPAYCPGESCDVKNSGIDIMAELYDLLHGSISVACRSGLLKESSPVESRDLKIRSRGMLPCVED